MNGDIGSPFIFVMFWVLGVGLDRSGRFLGILGVGFLWLGLENVGGFFGRVGVGCWAMDVGRKLDRGRRFLGREERGKSDVGVVI